MGNMRKGKRTGLIKKVIEYFEGLAGAPALLLFILYIICDLLPDYTMKFEEKWGKKGGDDDFDPSAKMPEMRYYYKKVLCPSCEQFFMWPDSESKGSSVQNEYIFKDSGKILYEAKCPKCGHEMLVAEKEIRGIDKDDERIECISSREK